MKLAHFVAVAALTIAFLSAGAFVAHAEDGKMYDVCKTSKIAMAIASQLRDIDQGSVAEDGILINAAYTAGQCKALAINFSKAGPLKEFARIKGEASDYVVSTIIIDDGMRYAVVEEAHGTPIDTLQPADALSLTTALASLMCEVVNAHETYSCIHKDGCFCPVE